MKRATLAIIGFLALSASACAQNARLEVGLNGFFPVGGWTNCRISGLGDIPDGTPVSVVIDEMFVRTMTAKGDVAEGAVLMSDDMPIIRIEVPGREYVSLLVDDLRRLHGVKDQLPVIFIGDNAISARRVQELLGAGGILPIRMSADDFLSRKREDVAWVHAFALGNLSADQVEGLRKQFHRFSNSVVVGPPDTVLGWLSQLPFERVDNVSISNRGLAPFLPIPRGSVRPELYEIFGPPQWPKSARQGVALTFGVILLVTAIYMIRPIRKLRGTLGGVLFIVVALAAFFAGRSTWTSTPDMEAVSIFQGLDDARIGVQTDICSRAYLSSENASSDEAISDVTPVASYPGQWVEHKLMMDAEGRLSHKPAVPSRDVFVNYSCGSRPEAVEGLLRFEGETVRRNTGVADSTGDVLSQSLAEYLAERHHDDARVDELRAATLRYWRKYCYRGGACAIGWTRANAAGRTFSAGTMVVLKVKGE